MSASTVLQAITVLAPIIEKVAAYINDESPDLPDVPGVLKSDIELKRFEARRKKSPVRPPPIPPRKPPGA